MVKGQRIKKLFRSQWGNRDKPHVHRKERKRDVMEIQSYVREIGEYIDSFKFLQRVYK